MHMHQATDMRSWILCVTLILWLHVCSGPTCQVHGFVVTRGCRSTRYLTTPFLWRTASGHCHLPLFSSERPTHDTQHSTSTGTNGDASSPGSITNKVEREGDKDDPTRQVVFIEPGNELEAISDDLWEEIEGAQPPKWLVMKEILGIGAFTYILGFLIVVMLSLNAMMGPGWLGQAIGIAGTGTFTEVSPSLPDSINLGVDEFLL